MKSHIHLSLWVSCLLIVSLLSPNVWADDESSANTSDQGKPTAGVECVSLQGEQLRHCVQRVLDVSSEPARPMPQQVDIEKPTKAKSTNP